MKKAILALGVLALAVGACTALLPERFAVNAPVLHMLLGRGVASPEEATVHDRLRAPGGDSITLYARDLPNVRMLLATGTGDLIASQSRQGRVVLVERDADGDGRSDGRRVLFSDLDGPHGLALRDGWLWIAEMERVSRVRFDPETRTTTGDLEPVVTGLPRGGNHWTRTIGFGPEGHLYVSVGSSCNVCEEEDPRRAAILRYDADGGGEQIWASGLRNAVDFAWRPGTNELYATDNGRDLLGDDFPPCELNRVVQGGFYGWPYANGNNVMDPDLGAGHEAEIAKAIPPVHGFAAHNAPLGMDFVSPDRALVALHGSWNRTTKSGYKVVSLDFARDGSISEHDYLVGFEKDGDVIGRPVDVIRGDDGAVYVSDDYASSIYRVAGPGAASPASRIRPSGE